MTKEDYEKLAPETILKQTGKLVAFMLAGQYFVAEGYGNKSIYNRNSNPIAQSTSKASNARVGTSSAQVTEIDGGILLNRKIYAYDQENNYYYGPVPTKEILHLLNTDPDYRERWKKPGGIHYYRKSNQTN